MGVTLVTDSTCDLPHEMCAARGIEVAPMGAATGTYAGRGGLIIAG